MLQLDSLLALSPLHIGVLVDLMQRNWLTYARAFDHEGGNITLFFKNSHIHFFLAQLSSVSMCEREKPVVPLRQSFISHVIKI